MTSSASLRPVHGDLLAETTRIPLCVPYWDEVAALNAGATYAPGVGFTIASDAFLENVWAWLPRRWRVPRGQAVLLPDMLPVTTWEMNVRNIYGTERWDKIRKHCYQAAGFRCEICGTGGRIEAHEHFQLVNETGVQRLDAILALCPLCHKAHHLGIARRLNMIADVRKHMCRVNGWSPAMLDAAIQDSFETWEQRCEWPWTVDLEHLYRVGLMHS